MNRESLLLTQIRQRLSAAPLMDLACEPPVQHLIDIPTFWKEYGYSDVLVSEERS